MKERPDVGVYVKDLSTFVVNNADDMDRIMTLGNKNRQLMLFLLCYDYVTCVINCPFAALKNGMHIQPQLTADPAVEPAD